MQYTSESLDLLKNQLKATLLGLAVGDALGVPVEFEERADMVTNPVQDMRGYGTYDLPAGTWSDDTSLTICLIEALIQGFDLNRIAHNFVRWAQEGWWTPYGEVFDIGIATADAVERLVAGISPEKSGGNEEYDNGNGSLMRILPLVFYVKNRPIAERFQHVQFVSSITHGHVRSVIACFYYVEFARQILDGSSARQAYNQLQLDLPTFLVSESIDMAEIEHFHRLFFTDISLLDSDAIQSSGYVVHTLEATIWCLLTTSSFSESVLKAVNLGDDADTTAAVTGGLAGLVYGADQIPAHWIQRLARKEDLLELIDRWVASQLK